MPRSEAPLVPGVVDDGAMVGNKLPESPVDPVEPEPEPPRLVSGGRLLNGDVSAEVLPPDPELLEPVEPLELPEPWLPPPPDDVFVRVGVGVGEGVGSGTTSTVADPLTEPVVVAPVAAAVTVAASVAVSPEPALLGTATCAWS